MCGWSNVGVRVSAVAAAGTTLAAMSTSHLDINALPLSDAFKALNPIEHLRGLFTLARQEDLATTGDITSQSLLLHEQTTRGAIVPRREGIVCGWEAAPLLVEAYGQPIEIEINDRDGACVQRGTTCGAISGRLADVLAIERPLLNLLSHLSGVATLTNQFVEAVRGTRARVFDTRKTLPGWRGLEKYAVRCGGGWCHRIGLYDAILVKDNHLADINPAELTRWLSERLALAREQHTPRFIEVEVDSLEQLRAVMACPAGVIDVVLLDNMTPSEMREAVALRDDTNPDVELEASGGVTIDSIRAIAEAGVDRIAVGALTHSAPHLDIGLDLA